MLSPSAKVVTLRARPVTGSKSERMRTVSVPCSTGSGGAEAARKAMPFSVQCLSKVGMGWPSASRRAGQGYREEPVTQTRPKESKARLKGF